jgi:hypothetical protein
MTAALLSFDRSYNAIYTEAAHRFGRLLLSDEPGIGRLLGPGRPLLGRRPSNMEIRRKDANRPRDAK